MNSNLNCPYTFFCENNERMPLKVSSHQALSLECLLNLSEHQKTWRELGDILYKWRLNPNYVVVEHASSYVVSKAQYLWISAELNKMKL